MKKLFKKILAVGLAASMVMGMAVTSFADEETTEPEVTTTAAEIWANGKDIKAKGDNPAVPYKTYVKEISDLLADETAEEVEAVAEETEATEETETTEEVQVGLNAELGENCKYVFSVTGTDVEDVAEAYTNGKGLKSNLAKAAYKKAKNDTPANVTVTAGKEAGVARIWIAEVNKEKEVVAYSNFDVTVYEAPKKFTVAATIDEKTVEKKATVNVGTSVSLSVVLPEGVTASEETTYTWSVKAPKDAAETAYSIEADGKTATFKVSAMSKAGKTDKYTVVCVNNQSQKKATFAVTVTNDLTTVRLPETTMDSAAEAKVETTLGWASAPADGKYVATTDIEATAFDTTDKIKLYVANGTVDSEAAQKYVTVGEKADKFKFTGEKSKALTAKFDKKTGNITLVAKKGTTDGTTATVVMAVTHADKTIDVYVMPVTIGTASAESGDTSTEG